MKIGQLAWHNSTVGDRFLCCVATSDDGNTVSVKVLRAEGSSDYWREDRHYAVWTDNLTPLSPLEQLAFEAE